MNIGNSNTNTINQNPPDSSAIQCNTSLLVHKQALATSKYLGHIQLHLDPDLNH